MRASARPVVRIAEPEGFSDEAVARLREVASVELQPCAAAELAEVLASCDVFWFRLGHRIDAEALRGARCRVIACPVTGLDHIDEAACAARKVRIVSLRGETAFLRRVRATAELTVGLAIALMRHLPRAAASVLAGQWDRDAFRGSELFEKTVGLVGVGRLGSICAEYFRAFGMRVLGCDPRPDVPDWIERRTLLELVAESDVISIHAAYNPSSHHLIDARVLAAVNPSAVLINTARGAIVDDSALLGALREHRLAGAALDVIEGEPNIGLEHPLVDYARQHDNLLLVPHLGGNTRESFVKTELFLADRVIEALVAAGLA